MNSRAAAGLLAMVLVVTITAWACGDGDDGAGTAGATLTVIAEDTKFNPTTITIRAGEEFTLELKNNDPIEHDFQVDGLDVDVIAGGVNMPDHAGDRHGGPSSLAMHTDGHESMAIRFTADDPGRYEFYCTIPGHKDSGMVGTLIVE